VSVVLVVLEAAVQQVRQQLSLVALEHLDKATRAGHLHSMLMFSYALALGEAVLVQLAATVL
jgi:hypothetical protein